MSYSIRDMFLAYDCRKHLPVKEICLNLKKLSKMARDDTNDEQFKEICKGFIRLVSKGQYDEALKSIKIGYEYYLISESTKEFVNNLKSTTV